MLCYCTQMRHRGETRQAYADRCLYPYSLHLEKARSCSGGNTDCQQPSGLNLPLRCIWSPIDRGGIETFSELLRDLARFATCWSVWAQIVRARRPVWDVATRRQNRHHILDIYLSIPLNFFLLLIDRLEAFNHTKICII